MSAATAGRIPLIDAAKGLACAVIVGHHMARYGPMAESAGTLAPALFGWLAEEGRLAVQVFLVIAGFLAAGSMAPEGVLRIDRPLLRVLRRYARLVMPYLVALSCSVLIAALVRPWLHDTAVPEAPVVAQLLAHGLLLQDLLGYEALSSGVWYVAIDFQLFVLALAVCWCARALERRWQLGAARARWLAVAPVLALAAVSLLVFNRHPALDDTALYFFGAYGLGMLSFWIGRATRVSTWRWAALMLTLLGGAALAIDWRSRIALALVAALAITVAQRRRWLADAWPAALQPLLRLGALSYSLFLIHFPMILLVNAVVDRWWPDRPWIALLGMGGAFVLSLAAAELLYRQVELRIVTWRAVLALFAGLMACGALSAAV